jgi:calcium-dependent protein kinase
MLVGCCQSLNLHSNLLLHYQADVDQDGSIDYGEFIAATMNMNKIEKEENLFAAFSYFDKDKSGYITVDELQQACAEHNVDEASIGDMIKEADQDNVRELTLNDVTLMQYTV